MKKRLNVLEVQLAAFSLEETETEKKMTALQSTTAYAFMAGFMLAIMLITRFLINNNAGISATACIEAVALVAVNGLYIWIAECRRNSWANTYPDEWYGRMPRWYMATVRPGEGQAKVIGLMRMVAKVVAVADVILLAVCIYPPIASHSGFEYCVMPVTVTGSVLINVADEWAHDVEFYAVWQNVLEHKRSAVESEAESTEE